MHPLGRMGVERVDVVVDCVIRWRPVVERGGYPHTGACRWCEADVFGGVLALPRCEGTGHPSGPFSRPTRGGCGNGEITRRMPGRVPGRAIPTGRRTPAGS